MTEPVNYTKETHMEEFGFLFIGLGFFLLVVLIILRSDREDYNRRLNEQREFGFRFDMKERPQRKSRD